MKIIHVFNKLDFKSEKINISEFKLTILCIMKVTVKRIIASIPHENIIKGLLLNFDINSGPNKEVKRLTEPAPKFAHSALALVRPAASKIETE